MNVCELSVANVGVDCGCVETGMTEHALDGLESRAAVHEVSGAGMAKQVARAWALEAHPV